MLLFRFNLVKTTIALFFLFANVSHSRQSSQIEHAENSTLINYISKSQSDLANFIERYTSSSEKIKFSGYSYRTLYCAAIQLELSNENDMNLQLAEKIYLYLIDLDPSCTMVTRAKIALGEIYLKKGKIHEAEKLVKNIDNPCYKVLELLGDCMAAKNEWSRAFCFYQKSYEKGVPRSYRASLKLSSCYNLGCGVAKDQVKAAELREASLQRANAYFIRQTFKILEPQIFSDSKMRDHSYDAIFFTSFELRDDAIALSVPNSLYYLAICNKLGLGGYSADEIEYTLLEWESRAAQILNNFIPNK